ncbi:unnamed protein product [Heligmosomoides polygyrus]|uniref:LAM_G_DOMAIN domain-containing protein n=1 Tax=Heligmosomoides polygyrus TaxID=6339 RepID=A0A183FLY3_HELPZ|nr:unnamed protein product [Heligmosomoides polygyrus]
MNSKALFMLRGGSDWIASATHTDRFMPSARPAIIDTYDLPGQPSLPLRSMNRPYGDVLRGHRFNVGIDTGSLIPRAKGTQLLVDVNGRLAEIPLRRSGPSSFTGTFLAHELGSINMKVLFDEALVKESNVNVRPGHNAAKCSTTGEGLRTAVVGKPAKFDINAQVSMCHNILLCFELVVKAKWLLTSTDYCY